MEPRFSLNESAQDDVAVDEDVMVERLSSFVVEVERCVSEERKEGEGVTDEPVAHDEGLSDSCEDGIRASQIDTSAQLSQGTLNAMFGDLQVDIRNVMRQHLELRAALSKVRAISTVRVLRSRTRVKKDVNFIPEDENMSVYESFSSGESDGEVLAEEDEDDMDETFVASLQVGKGALDKRAMKQREDALRAMEWNQFLRPMKRACLHIPV
ncbi:hypothetical protein GQ600_11401 [Phytophthora cactorum]|nr:hypothetical protein GQ600_11401 [Phytophthora cactorum]